MAMSSWYRGIIEQSRQFMSYVKGWTWYDSADGPNYRPVGSFVVPQKYDEVPPVGLFHRFLTRQGGVNADSDYIHTIDNTYERVPQGAGVNVLCDYRSNNNFDYGKNVGVSLRGSYTVSNQATQDFLLTEQVAQDPYWKRNTGQASYAFLEQGDFTGSFSNLKDIIPFNINPFDQTTTNTCINFNQQIHPLIYNEQQLFFSTSNSHNYTYNLSFFIWKGWLNQEELSQRLINLGATNNGARNFSQRFTSNTIGINIKSQTQLNRRNEDNWIDDTNSYLAINYVDKNWSYYSDDIRLNVPKYEKESKCWKVSNVQFEDAPNDFVRVKIGFYIDCNDRSRVLDWKYPVLQFTFGNQTNNAEWFYHLFENNMATPTQYQDALMVLWGVNTNYKSFYQTTYYDAWGDTCDYPDRIEPFNAKYPIAQSGKYYSYFQEYIPNNTSSFIAKSKTVYSLYNPTKDNVVPFSGCKMLYLHYYFGNSSHGKNDTYFGKSPNADGRNFLTLDNNVPAFINNQCGAYLAWDTNRVNNYRIPLFKYNPPSNPCNAPIMTPSIYSKGDTIPMSAGHNKIAIVASSSEDGSYVYVNGKKYPLYSTDFSITQLSQVTLAGRSNDLLLEYGWFDEPLSSNNLKKLTQI